MVILNAKKVPALLALFLTLTVGAWAQQEREASPGTQIDNIEAKKALYRELGIEWNYNDGASMEVAKEVVKSKQAQVNSNSGLAPSVATISGNAPAKIQTAEEKIAAYQLELRNLKYNPKTDISTTEYATFPANKKAYVQSHPEKYTIGGVAISAGTMQANVQPGASAKQVITTEQLKNMSPERQKMVNSHPETYEVK